MLLADITLQDWLTAAGILVGSVVVAIVIGRVLNAVLQRRTMEASLAIAFVVRLVRWAIVLFGLVYAAGEIGVEIGPLVGALGITGLAVALALQPVMQNLFAGVVLQTERPIDCGDEVETAGYQGVVLDVTGRATVIETYDGAVVSIPNAMVLDGPIVNHTRNRKRRSTVVVGVAYRSDVAQARDALAAAVGSVAGVASSPAPVVVVKDFGASSVDIDVDFWHEPAEAVRRAVRSDVVGAVHRALAEAGIEIPFPQRDVWFRSEGEGH